MDSERRQFFKKEIDTSANKNKRRLKGDSANAKSTKRKETKKNDLTILGSQSYKEQIKPISILASRNANKNVCKKLFTPDANDAEPIHKEHQCKNKYQIIGRTDPSSEIEDRRLISSQIIIDIEPEDVEVEKIPPSHKNLEITTENEKVSNEKQPSGSSTQQKFITAKDISDAYNTNISEEENSKPDKPKVEHAFPIQKKNEDTFEIVFRENEPSINSELDQTTAEGISNCNINILEIEKNSEPLEGNSKPEEQKVIDDSTAHSTQEQTTNEDMNHESEISEQNLISTATEMIKEKDKNLVSETSEQNLPSTLTEMIQEKDKDVFTDHLTQKETTNEDKNPESEMSEQNLHSTLTEIIPEKEMDMIRKSLEEDEEICPNSNELLVSPEAKAKRKKRARKAMNKSYVDFLSEEEDFVWDSSSWKETGDESESSSINSEAPRKKKKKVISKDGKVGEAGLKKKRINKRKLRSERRKNGKSYVKKDGSVVNEKELKPNPCLGKKCGHNCGEIDEQKRRNLFDYFWGLSSQGKKDWIVAMSSSQEVKRKRSKTSGYRSRTYNYFINDGEGRRQVCLKFILNTLDISQKYIQYTISTASFGIAKEDSRGKFVPSNKTSEDNKESARNWIKSLPALPSHYCRKDSTRLYLPEEFKNIKNLHRIYKETKASEGVDCLSEKLFRNIFLNEFNLGFHVPKKDKCLKCLKFEAENENDCPEKQAHLDEKKASKARLECHRLLVKENPSILCTSFDLQKVLNTPHGSNIQLYYSRKYAVYNLCFYESHTRSGFCYVWGESEGNRGANEVATILQKYIKDVDARGTIKSLILYSDSCPGQNKNKIVLAALHNALLQSTNLETIQMNYLLPGHTEMTVDSIHSTIEHSVRNTTVWAPSQWVTICQLGRKEPKPYNVEGLTHQDFMSFDDLADKYFKGNLIGKISKLRIATFKKSAPSTMKVKYSMKEDSPEEKIQIVAKPKLINQRYASSLPITNAKYKDLKKLCVSSVIPRVFHAEYLSLNSAEGNDELIDTDLEDEVDE